MKQEAAFTVYNWMMNGEWIRGHIFGKGIPREIDEIRLRNAPKTENENIHKAAAFLRELADSLEKS